MFDQLPDNILEFIKEKKVGQLSVRTKRGVLVHPIAYYCDGEGLVFGTPRSSAKLNLLKENPRVSFTVDNGKLMKEGMGITVVGKTETYGFKSLATSLRSAVSSMFGYVRKYPELLKFYIADMGELPDDRKFYKYVFVRINPTRIVHWDGYNFGRITSRTKKKKKEEPDLEKVEPKPEDDPVIYAKYVMDYYKGLEDIGEDFEEDLAIEDLAGDVIGTGLELDSPQGETLDVTTLLSLPDHLRKTGVAVMKLKKGSVDDVAAEIGSTKRETKSYLDRLTLMNILNKKREGEHMIYYIR
jgi:hypothetical protein